MRSPSVHKTWLPASLSFSLLPRRAHPFSSQILLNFCISWFLSWENKSQLQSVKATAEGCLAGRNLAGFSLLLWEMKCVVSGCSDLGTSRLFLFCLHTHTHTHTSMHVPFLASCPASPSLPTAVFLISRRYILLGANPPFLCAFLTSYLMHGSLVSLEMRRHKGEADIRGLTAIMAVYKPNPSRLVDTSIFVPLKRYK